MIFCSIGKHKLVIRTPMVTVSVLVFIFFLLVAEASNKRRRGCEQFTCGEQDFKFPFFSTTMPSRCGLFKLNCSANIREIQFDKDGKWYKVESVSETNKITITDTGLNQSLITGHCSDLSSFSLPDSPWLNLTTLYKCNNSRRTNDFSFANCRGEGSSLYYNLGDGHDVSECSAIQTPESWVTPRKGNQYDVNATFSLHIDLPHGCFRCHYRGGECKMIKDMYYCDEVTKEQKYDQERIKLGLGVSAGSTVIIIIVVAIIVRAKITRKNDWNDKNIEAVVMLKRYSYAKVKKMTSSFSHVLGKGGFGTVYKGKLPDGGIDVAVKILKEAKGNREDFINEVASMSRTSHVNIVSLLGFCLEGSKRALIYEFMPNGSLDKFISKRMSTKMEWERLYDISVGICRGLEYLHNRCVTRIVHFDIKPQNILIDKDLCPKISDFGLAKLCENKESIMSMLDARGTVGYIAPEVFSRNFGRVSHKSDVYSYGMMVLEMIGAKNIEKVEHSRTNNSSMYFPDWIYKDFGRGEVMRIFGDQITEEEEKLAKKLVLVGLWCIQTNPSDRPPMIKVIEMLDGNLEALQVPPKPLWCLPTLTVPETLEDSYETSSFSDPSQFERRTLSACEDTLRFSKEVDQLIVEESQHRSRS